jgi:glycosyltransferase involved in cell wall biosynthesis
MARRPLARALAAALADGFDLVHVQTPFRAHYAGLAAGRAAGVPVVESYHTYFEHYLEHYVPLLPGVLLRRLARAFSRAQGNAVDRLVVPSTAMRDVLAGYGVRSPMAVVPTGFDASLGEGDGAAFRRRHGIADRQPLLLVLGRLGHEKNLLFLLEVFAALSRRSPDALLLVAGEGPARDDLVRTTRRRGLAERVRFVGYLARDGELAACYRAADVLLFASRTETQGLVLLEAMALGVPIVTTAEMGTRDLLAAGRGARVVEESVDAFAGAVLEVLRDRALSDRLRREGPEVAREWSATAMAARLLGEYAAVLASPAKRARLTPSSDSLPRP